ncbi:GntR family transcriptional regulator [Bradyrhizobium sp.]|uniref:GntR family transcriptional regulator n=1 Tax=Bradyrhizobium sp. TaxID=376 RepID=UPI001ECF20FF|nr:GntR family transcriptional regulator [Bradyrhizobium sp.]MBV8922390.1 GntR family transcriptional regulator [Bradyrhizobium sp.]MBV9979372.1 GntR family transcriptional regulator [Bradyrhizobium sp.]
MALLADLPRPLADNVIVERVFAAVMEHKLPPGAKLAENALCEAFEASRAQIRRVLVVLAGRSVVTLHPNRGAYVSSPSASEAREVFEARRAIERSVVLSAATAIDERTLAELRANSRAGAAAEARGERSESIRLSGQFHIRLAEIAGNSVLTRYLEELVARTSLIIGLYGSTRARTCSEAEHDTLLDALAAGDKQRAADLMEEHLHHIEEALDVRDTPAEPVDIRQILQA